MHGCLVFIFFAESLRSRLKRLRSWTIMCLVVNLVWLTSLCIRAALVYGSGLFTGTTLPPVMWLLWIVIDLLWISISNMMTSRLVSSDEITEATVSMLMPSAVISVSDSKDEEGSPRATGLFLDTFTEEEVQLSISNEMPIWRRWPGSVTELVSWPHPVNEVQNQTHSIILAFIQLPLSILLLNYTSFKWYIAIPLAGTFLRLCFAYRLDPQAWLVLLLTRPFKPTWISGPPKRFAAFMSFCLQAVALVLVGVGQNKAASWIIAIHIVLSINQSLGFCLACGVFFLLAKIGLIPQETCKKCMQRFLSEEDDPKLKMTKSSAAYTRSHTHGSKDSGDSKR
jgi:hypothetical protein